MMRGEGGIVKVCLQITVWCMAMCDDEGGRGDRLYACHAPANSVWLRPLVMNKRLPHHVVVRSPPRIRRRWRRRQWLLVPRRVLCLLDRILLVDKGIALRVMITILFADVAVGFLPCAPQPAQPTSLRHVHRTTLKHDRPKVSRHVGSDVKLGGSLVSAHVGRARY
jgi:hypothetical protein